MDAYLVTFANSVHKFIVTEARNAQEALWRARAQAPGVVLEGGQAKLIDRPQTIVQGEVKDCCKDPLNLDAAIHGDHTCRVCRVCHCRHWSLKCDPIQIGVQGSGCGNEQVLTVGQVMGSPEGQAKCGSIIVSW